MNIKEEPVFSFYEETGWLRIEAKGQPDRYLKKDLAVRVLEFIGHYSVREKNDFVLIQ